MMKPRFACEMAGIFLLLYFGHLTVTACSLSDENFEPLFAETGPYERMSILLWLLLAVMLLCALKSVSRFAQGKLMVMSMLSVIFAAREANWHKEFTVMSIEKIKFYLSPDVPGLQKLLGGLALFTVIAILAYLAHLFYRFLKEDQGLQTPLGQVLLFPACLLPLSKLLDRFSSQMHEIFKIRVKGLAGRLISAYEEGMEMILPVLFIAALLLYRQQQRLQ
jgi:hypothetical protein